MTASRRSSLITPLGLVLVLLGAVWFAQGIGWLGGSSMTDQTRWAVIGSVVAVLGALMAGIGLTAPARRRSGDG